MVTPPEAVSGGWLAALGQAQIQEPVSAWAAMLDLPDSESIFGGGDDDMGDAGSDADQ